MNDPVADDFVVRDVAFVRRVARALVRDEERAADVAQETLLAATLRPPTHVASWRAWVRTVVDRIGRRQRTAAARRTDVESAWRPDPRRSDDPAIVAAERELLKRVVDEVYDLAEPYRQTLLLRFLDDLELDTIAARMNVPKETVKTRLQRGLQRVRERLDRDHPSRAAWVTQLARFAAPTVRITLAVRAGAAMLATVAACLLVAPWLDPEQPRDPPATALATPDAPPIESLPIESLDRTSVVPVPDALPPLRARVIDVEGRPIEGARIRVYACDAPLAAGVAIPPLASAATASDGRFSLPPCDVAPVSLAIDREGFTSRVIPVASCGECGDIVLGPALTLEGVVRDLERRPIAGARVRFSSIRQVVEAEIAATTDAEGRYRLVGVLDPARDLRGSSPRDSTSAAVIQVDHPEYAPLIVSQFGLEDHDGDGAFEFDLWLVRGATIQGRVLDAETGQPCPGVRVELKAWGSHNLFLAERSIEHSFWRPVVASGLSDSAGNYRLTRVPAWGVTQGWMHHVAEGERRLGVLAAEADDWKLVEAVSYATEIRLPDDGATVERDVRVLSVCRVRGRVVDVDGRAIAGVSAGGVIDAVSDESGNEVVPRVYGSAPSGSDGRFEFTIAARRHVVSAGVLELQSFRRSSEYPMSNLRGGTIVDVGDQLLGPEAPSSLIATVGVFTAEGTPVPSARVELFEASMGKESEGQDLAIARSDSEGAATLRVTEDWLKEVAQARIRVDAYGFDSAFSEPIALASAVATPRSIRLELVRSDFSALPPKYSRPEPTSQARVIVSLLDSATNSPLVRPRSLVLANEEGGRREHRAIAPGEFVFEEVPPGTWNLWVRVDEYLSPGPIALAVNSTADELRQSVALSRGSVIRGIVRASEGLALGGASISFAPTARGSFQQAKLDSNQRFESTALVVGEPYRVSVSVTDGRGRFRNLVAPSPVIVPAVATEFVITVVPGVYAFVTSRDPRLSMPVGSTNAESREFAAKSRLLVRDTGGTSHHETRCTPCSGLPVFLPAGTYVFRLELADGTAQELEVLVAGEERIDVEFPAPR